MTERMSLSANRIVPALLWIDCVGALVVGGLVLTGYRFLSDWYHVDWRLILFMGLANILYGCYSLSLAIRRHRPLPLIVLLAIANMGWAAICLALLWTQWHVISLLGVVHLFGEAIYVASLGLMELIFRQRLTTAWLSNI